MIHKSTDFRLVSEVILDEQDAAFPENFVKWCSVVKIALKHLLYSNGLCYNRNINSNTDIFLHMWITLNEWIKTCLHSTRGHTWIGGVIMTVFFSVLPSDKYLVVVGIVYVPITLCGSCGKTHLCWFMGHEPWLAWNEFNSMVTCEINASTSVWNNFISAHRNLSEIVLKLFQKFIAAHGYFTMCSLSLK